MSDVAAAQAEIERWLVRFQQAPESKAFAPLADAYRAAGRQQDAVRVLETGLQRYPDYVSGLVLLGLCWRELHEDDRAETAFARVLELDPDNLVALRHRAECARRRGVLERAGEYLRRALAIDPFDRDVQADLGLVTAALERQARERLDPSPPQTGGPRVAAARPAAGDVAPYPAPAPPAAEPFPLPPVQSLPVPQQAAAPVWPAPPAPPEPVAPAASAAAPLPPPAPPVEAAPPVPETRGRAAVEPPTIDLRRVGRAVERESPAPAPAPAPPAAASSPEAPPAPAAPDRQPSWRYTRDSDRIVVAPTDTPVRGPIRSVEDRLFAAQRPLGETVPLAPAAPAPPPVPAAPGGPGSSAAIPSAPTGEFATMTLARIYESQGYLQKAAAIYETLQRQRPGDAEIAQRLAALRKRQASPPEAASPPAHPPAPGPARVPATPPAPRPAAPPAPPVAPFPAVPAAGAPPQREEDRGVAWRLLDADAFGDPTSTAQRLRNVTQAARVQEQGRHHTVIGTPPSPGAGAPASPGEPAAAPPEDLSRGHEDYQRFLSYLRSLRP